MPDGISVGQHVTPPLAPVLIAEHAGIPFNDTSDFRFQIAEQGEAILGDNLLGFQAANEPDLYAAYVRPCF